MNMDYPGIYAITCAVNGKQYIGSSKNIYQRWHAHKHLLNKKKNHCLLLQNAWNKYGEDAFTISVIERVDDLEQLITREQYYLDTRQPAYNLRKVAERNTGITWSPESVEKTAAKNRGKKRPPEFGKNVSERLRGVKKSDAHIAKLKAAKANMSKETRKRMSDAKKGIAPLKATQAAAKVCKGKKRPQEVVDRIRQTRLETWERQRAEGYQQPPRDEQTGQFLKRNDKGA